VRNQWLPSGIADGLGSVVLVAVVEEAVFRVLWHKDTPPIILVTVCVATFSWRLWRAFRKANAKGRA